MSRDRTDLLALVERFGTPLYVYDLARVRRAHRDLAAALPTGTVLHYSLKANPHPRLVGQLAALGCHAEVSSIGELDTAVAAGVAAGQQQMTGPGKTETTIAHALRLGVRRFSVDSPHDLARVGALAAACGVSAECLLRVNPDQPVAGMGLAMTGVATQFGADASWIASRPELFCGVPRAPLTGLHFYAGTNLIDEDALVRQFEVSIRLAAQLSTVLPGITRVNLGGGFGTPYARAGRRPFFAELAGRLAGLLDEHLPGWHAGAPRIAFESGRYLVGDAGTLVARIVDVKTSKGRRFVVLDAGVHHLGGMSGLRRLRPLVPTIDMLAPATERPPETCTVVGPLCTPLDTLARDVPLADPRPGQLVSIPNVGAYGLTASLLAFLGHPAPVEVVVDGGDLVNASRLSLARTPLAV